MIRVGVRVFDCGQKKFESYFSGRFTLSNIYCRTARQIYKLALTLLAPEKLSSSSKSRIFLYKAHIAPFVQKMTQLRSNKLIGKYYLELALEVRALPLPLQTIQRCELGLRGALLLKRFAISVRARGNGYWIL